MMDRAIAATEIGDELTGRCKPLTFECKDSAVHVVSEKIRRFEPTLLSSNLQWNQPAKLWARRPFLAHVGISHEPGVDHLLLKAPLTAHFEGRNSFLSYQSVNGKSVHLQIVSNLLNGNKFLHCSSLAFQSRL
jgi:hypothetical protein